MKKVFACLFMGVCVFVFGQETLTSGDFQYIIEETGTGRTIAVIGYTGSDSIITIPASIDGIPVTIIGSRNMHGTGFQFIENITQVILPDTVETIGYVAFYGCSNLKTINIPASLKEVWYGAFGDPTNRIWYGIDRNIRTELVTRFTDEIFESPW